jgi:hypothetical protein
VKPVQNDAQNDVRGGRSDAQIGTYVLVVFDTQIAGYGASSIVPEAAVMCD